jgi:hypothetical protein
VIRLVVLLRGRFPQPAHWPQRFDTVHEVRLFVGAILHRFPEGDPPQFLIRQAMLDWPHDGDVAYWQTEIAQRRQRTKAQRIVVGRNEIDGRHVVRMAAVWAFGIGAALAGLTSLDPARMEHADGEADADVEVLIESLIGHLRSPRDIARRALPGACLLRW